MALSAIDIEQKTFRVALRGYAEEEVDAFLDEIISTVRSLEQQLQESRSRAIDLESRVSGSRDTEDRLTRTLVLAQKTADEVVREARYEAQQILSQARLDASEIESEHAGKKERLGSEVQSLQNAVTELRAHVRGLTDRLLQQVEETESAMSDVVPPELEAITPVGDETFESPMDVEDADDKVDEGFESALEDIDVDEEIDDDGDEAEDAGEVYLGSDRRPWERYGD
jgi:cell division initiation protein